MSSVFMLRPRRRCVEAWLALKGGNLKAKSRVSKKQKKSSQLLDFYIICDKKYYMKAFGLQF